MTKNEEHHDRCATHIDITLRCTCEREYDWDEYQRTSDAMDGLSESMNPTLPELDSYEDGPIDGYDY